jgi:TatD DNase family protein
MMVTTRRVAESYPFMYSTIGASAQAANTEETFTRMRELAAHSKTVAVGEIGLDYHSTFSADAARSIPPAVEMAAEFRKPIVIHTRGVGRYAGGGRAVRQLLRRNCSLHCLRAMRRRRGRRWRWDFISYGGVLTFPKAAAVREAASITPEDRLLIETDCPYLAPVPFRGKRNEPAYVVETARRLAEVRGAELETIAAVTTRNFEQLCLRGESRNG